MLQPSDAPAGQLVVTTTLLGFSIPVCIKTYLMPMARSKHANSLCHLLPLVRTFANNYFINFYLYAFH
jgi:hypothetical protein